MKINVSLNDDLVKRMDVYAGENYMTRSALMSFAVVQFLNQHEAILALKNVAVSIKKIADTNTVDEETLEQIRDFERLAALFQKA